MPLSSELHVDISQPGLDSYLCVPYFSQCLSNTKYAINIHNDAISCFRSPMAGPLVDGMVVSQRSLGAMVRLTAINIGRRRRLDIDK